MPWGPLAVIREDSEVISAALGGEGELRISESCVTLAAIDPDREITLVWRDSQTSWNPAGFILFDDGLANAVLKLSDRLRIEVGGASSPASPWIAEPDPSCPNQLFVAHSIDVLD
jgi:hypothetical protein